MGKLEENTSIPEEKPKEESPSNTNGSANVATAAEQKPDHIVKRFFRAVTIEPTLCCYILSLAISTLAVQQLYIEKACRTDLQHGDEICDGLLIHNFENLTEYETKGQELISLVNAWKNPLSTFLPAVMMLFIGSWSDRRGIRKPCILIPIMGDFITTIWLLVSSNLMKEIGINETGLVEGLCSACTGGFSVMLMGAFSYLGDITSEEDRTMRIGIASITVTVCFLIGGAASGILYEVIGYNGVFSLCAALYLIGILYGHFCVRESKINVEPSNVNFCVDFFNPTRIVETVKVCFKKRPDYGRLKIFLLIVTFLFALGPGAGEGSLAYTYLYTRVRFNWQPVDFTIFNTVDIVIHLIGTFIMVGVLCKHFGWSDPMIGILATCTTLAASVWCGISTSASMFYWSPVIGFFSGTKPIAVRSMATKLVPDVERGKVQSVFGLVESLLVTIFSPLYGLVYNQTAKTMPSSLFFMSVGLVIPAIVLFVLLYILERKVINRTEKSEIIGIENETFKYSESTDL